MSLDIETIREIIRSSDREASSSLVETVLSKMTLLEKLGQMTQINTGCMVDAKTKRLDPKLVDYYVRERMVGSFINTMNERIKTTAPSREVWVESINLIQEGYTKTRLKIPMVYGIDSVHGANYIEGATLFPQQLGIASTFNRKLARKVAEITAKDTRAVGIVWNFSPILDIAVNKQWPRVYETFGEDPYLAAQLGAEMIVGYQGCNELHRTDKVAATMKHFIGYSACRTGKDVDGSWIGERTVFDYFRPSFQTAVEVGAETVMESYSDIEGEHIVASKKYLCGLLRGEMGFKGVLVTDYEQINKLHEPIHIAPSITDAVRRVMELGTVDISMVPNNADFIDLMLELVNSKQVPEEFVDQSVRRILNLKHKLGLLNNNGMVDPECHQLSTIGCLEDREVSIEAARESVVLLQNINSSLPLPLNSNILVTGPVSDSLTYLTGGWSYTWQGPLSEDYFQERGTSILNGLQKHSTGSITHLAGVDIHGKLQSETVLDEIVLAASKVDAVVVCLGEPAYTEFKGNINDMYLPRGQLDLLDSLIEKSGKPVIVVLSEGRPRVTNPSIRQAAAVLVGFLIGPYGGDAFSEVIFGITNPSGKLPITYANHPNDNNLNYYRKFNEIYEDVYWEFGHGLSYTTFSYTNLQLSSRTMYKDSSITATVTLTNTGSRPGLETTLFYITDEFRSIAPEVKKLRHFSKHYLEPNQSTDIQFIITIQDLAYFDVNIKRVAEVGTFTLKVDGLSSQFELLDNDSVFIPVDF